jgi:hypothetical protein
MNRGDSGLHGSHADPKFGGHGHGPAVPVRFKTIGETGPRPLKLDGLYLDVFETCAIAARYSLVRPSISGSGLPHWRIALSAFLQRPVDTVRRCD